MIWKIITGLLGALLITGMFLYIPDLRFWNKRADKANTVLTDSLRSEQIRRQQAERSLAVNTESFERIQRDLEREADRRSAVLPNIKVEVGGLSDLAKRTGNLEALLRLNLLSAKDTSKSTPLISYNQPTNDALTIRLRLCDSVDTRNQVIEAGYSALKEAYQLRGDSLQNVQIWIDDGKDIANQKGIFTGRNRRLRKHSREPPI